ncbi:hypothetical protein G4942_11245 [Anaerostipes hadrus]|nr:hypothetical protein [Anaerostipes hadrus]NSH18031.1 hypothetical protein [Anaerostipes hadrus]NSH41100.1 hypothetical protein [Anaerostipes hadrus]NSH62629.1 hypothetical protein [Anaerostipes hadrus]
MNNGHTDCRISNLEFLKHNRNIKVPGTLRNHGYSVSCSVE